jgi:predicted amidophosphoribosyltransferase
MRLGLPVEFEGILRRRDTAHQPGLGREERRANLRDAFECRLDLRGRSVAIVDDVMTTGATASAFEAVLREAGATQVFVWVAARTPEPA